MTDVTDLKQVKVSRITLGLIMSVAITSGVVVWNAASIAGRIDDLEKQMQVIEGNTGQTVQFWQNLMRYLKGSWKILTVLMICGALGSMTLAVSLLLILQALWRLM